VAIGFVLLLALTRRSENYSTSSSKTFHSFNDDSPFASARRSARIRVQLTGSVIENPQGLHWNTFKLSANARLIVCSNFIGRPQTGQTTSTVWTAFSLIPYLRCWR
jgi:hypothetical protein